jgi:hypothetical protein
MNKTNLPKTNKYLSINEFRKVVEGITEPVSNCCSASMKKEAETDNDICSKCGEHCTVIEAGSDDEVKENMGMNGGMHGEEDFENAIITHLNINYPELIQTKNWEELKKKIAIDFPSVSPEAVIQYYEGPSDEEINQLQDLNEKKGKGNRKADQERLAKYRDRLTHWDAKHENELAAKRGKSADDKKEWLRKAIKKLEAKLSIGVVAPDPKKKKKRNRKKKNESFAITEFNSIHDPIGYNPNAAEEDRIAIEEIKALIASGTPEVEAIQTVADKYNYYPDYLTRKLKR